MVARFFALLVGLFTCLAAQAQMREHPDAMVLNRAKLVYQTDKVEVYSDGVEVDAELGAIFDQHYSAIESLIGRKYDSSTLGQKIKVVASSQVRVSQVWRGYQHMNDPKGVVFLNMRAYQGLKSKSNATLVHELTHLFTWKYNSHSLREGIADYVARAVMPNTAVGPNLANAVPSPVGWASKYLGSNLPAPPELNSDAEFRQKYYFLSYVLVKALIERTSMQDFMRFYDSPYSDDLFESIFKVKRVALVCELKLDTGCS